MIIHWEDSPTPELPRRRISSGGRWVSPKFVFRAIAPPQPLPALSLFNLFGLTRRRASRYRWPRACAALMLILSIAGCGYRMAGERLDSGAGRTMAVPVFRSLTTEFEIEQQLTDAVRLELIRRTRYRVIPARAGDVVVAGEVLGVTSIPIIFTGQGRGTAYSVAVDVSVRVTDTADGRVLFQNDRWTFSEVFELSNNSEEFVPEDTAAIDRLASNFAAALVASLTYLNSSP